MINAASPIMMKALDGLFLRQLVTAQNIANAGSVRYMPMRVSFESALRAAAATGPAATQNIQAQILPDAGHSNDGEMRLDLELQTAAETTMRYNALMTVMDHEMRLLGIAITGGA
jgi:flagellar basal-body rod protein FlgB